jgi:hypothetical protein
MIGKIVIATLKNGSVIQGLLCYEQGRYAIPNYWQHELSGLPVRLA